MPDINAKVVATKGYKKLLDVLEILKPGSRNEFIKHHQEKRSKSLH